MLSSCGSGPGSKPPTALPNKQHAATPDNAPSVHPAPGPASGGGYLGAKIGVAYGMHPEMSSLSLPDGMKRRWSLNHADGWQLVVAERSDDLVVLITDSAGVVTDGVTIKGRAQSHRVLHECGDDVIPSLILRDDCANGALSAIAVRAWYPRRGKLIEAQQPVQCFCETP